MTDIPGCSEYKKNGAAQGKNNCYARELNKQRASDDDDADSLKIETRYFKKKGKKKLFAIRITFFSSLFF